MDSITSLKGLIKITWKKKKDYLKMKVKYKQTSRVQKIKNKARELKTENYAWKQKDMLH